MAPNSSNKTGTETSGKNRTRSWWYWLLAVPFVATLWVPFFNAAEPAWQGIPFFYWYQFLWIIIGAAITAFVYLISERV